MTVLENKVTRVIHNKLEDVLHGIDMFCKSQAKSV